MNKKSKKKQKKPDKAPEANFKVGDLVGAKVKGHPIWPGFIEEVNNLNNKCKYTVRFFGSSETSQSCIEIKYFRDFTTKEIACSRKGFKEALLQCQERYDELRRTVKVEREHHQEDKGVLEEENSVPDKQSLDPPFNYETDKLIIEYDSDGTNDKKSKRKKGTSSSPSEVITPMETNDDKEIPAKSLNIAKDDTVQTKSPKSEGENVAEVSSVFDLALAKLKEKVAKKLEEKQACKIKKKEHMMSTKVSKKLVVINKTLKRFSKTVKELSDAKAITRSNIDDWNSAVQRYDNVSEILEKCIKYYSENNATKYGNSDVYRECQKILIEIFSDIDGSIKSAQMHDNFKEELRKFSMNVHPNVKEFINQQEPETFKNAMIERRDNDAEL